MPSTRTRAHLPRLAAAVLWGLVAAVAAVLGHGARTGGFPFYTRVDPETGTAALAVATDAGTGCQYILTPLGGIVPRTGADGKQRCGQRP